MQIFRSNQFFRGINMPEPEEHIGLQQKLPNANPIIIDFLMVNHFFYSANYNWFRNVSSRIRRWDGHVMVVVVFSNFNNKIL